MAEIVNQRYWFNPRQPPYRLGVLAFVLDESGQVLLGEQYDSGLMAVLHSGANASSDGSWAENPTQTLTRGLSKGLGFNFPQDAAFLAAHSAPLISPFNIPSSKYSGEMVFAMALLAKRNATINLAAGGKPAFRSYSWHQLEDLPRLVPDYIQTTYRVLAASFAPIKAALLTVASQASSEERRRKVKSALKVGFRRNSLILVIPESFPQGSPPHQFARREIRAPAHFGPPPNKAKP